MALTDVVVCACILVRWVQLNEMADAAECLHDVFEALRDCLVALQPDA